MNLFLSKQNTAHEMRISDWSSDVCSSDLVSRAGISISTTGATPSCAPSPACSPPISRKSQRRCAPSSPDTGGGTRMTAAPDLDGIVVEAVAAALGLDPGQLDRDERFSRYGLTSLTAAGLIRMLSERLGRPLPPTLVWDHPTTIRLIRHLAGGAAPAETGAP